MYVFLYALRAAAKARDQRQNAEAILKEGRVEH